MILKINPIKQLNIYYCGPACIEMVMRFFGKTSSKYKQKVIGTKWEVDDEEGMTITEMKRCLESLKIRPVRVTGKTQLSANRIIYYLNKYQLPIIIDTEFHFMLVVGFDKFNIFIIDPLKAKVKKCSKNHKLWKQDLEGYFICLPRNKTHNNKRRKKCL